MIEAESPVRGGSTLVSEAIADAIEAMWSHDGSTSVHRLAPTTVFLRERRLVEWVFDDVESAVSEADIFRQIRKRGIDVNLMFPIAELGRAHDEFWGSGLMLYGWIDRGDSHIRFTGPEIA
ncbi:hypothetical protein D2E74_04815 [Mycobacteroides abscessus]|nr:hypothetical protein D2E74_04815 [Mycobacteroides abscessus]